MDNEIIKEKDLLAYPLTFIKADDINGSAKVLIDDVTNFLEVCNSNQIKPIFYCYYFYNKEIYYADEEFIEDASLNDKEKTFWKKWAKKYNAASDAIDFTKPCKLILLCSLNTITIGCVLKDDWLNLDTAQDALDYYREEHEEEIFNLIDDDDDENEISLYEQFRSVLLADEYFRMCTNKNDRNSYLRSFLDDKKNKKYWKLAGMKTHAIYEKFHEITVVAHNIYNEYRQTCWNLKIPVGSALPTKKDDEKPLN